MSFPEYKHHPLELFIPDFDSDIADLIIDLDHLRRKEIQTSTHPLVFNQLITLFHTVESLGSARIEGNNTRLIELMDEDRISGYAFSEDIKEIRNLERTLAFIEHVIDDQRIDKEFICEIHRRIMEDLQAPPMGDGDERAGLYRQEELGIGKSSHLPPPPWEIDSLMKELTEFLEVEHSPKYDLIKSAQFHHRFVWIHPFANGNGRMARMLSYAIMIRQGFRVNTNRIINPTSVFCIDRNQYYRSLSMADDGSPEGVKGWCLFMLRGLKSEIEKIDRLADHFYLVSNILIPAIQYSVKNRFISQWDSKMLKIVIEKQRVSAGHFSSLFRDKLPQEVSRQIKRIRDLNLIIPETDGGRQYVINIRSDLLRMGILEALDQEGFLPELLSEQE